MCIFPSFFPCLFLCLALSLSGSPATAEPPAAKPESAFVELNFPGNQNFGHIYAMPVGYNFDQARRAPQRLVANAKGAVRLPRRWPLMFGPNDSISENANVFTHLPDDAFIGLDLEKLSLGDKEIGAILHFKSLLFVLMEGTEIGDAGLAKLQAMPKLNKIDVFGTNVTGSTVKDLVTLPDLHRLRLGCNKLNLACIDDICRLKKLTLLNLDRVKLSDKDLLKISRMQSLQTLEVPNNPNVTGVGLAYLKKMPNLRVLDLRGCSIKAQDLIGLKETKLAAVSVMPESFTRAELAAIKVALKGRKFCTFSRTEIMSPELFAPLK